MVRKGLAKVKIAGAAVALGVAVAVGGSVVSPAPASAVAYCTYYHHYGNCTWQERYNQNLIYWKRYTDVVSAVAKAIAEANANVSRLN